MEKGVESDSVSVDQLKQEMEKMRQEIARLNQQKELYEKERALAKANSVRNDETEGSVDVDADDRTEESGENLNSYQRMGITEVSLLIPKFSPSGKETVSAKDWINNIDNLKKVYGWDNKATMLYAVFRLEGAARYWYESRQASLKCWENFKVDFINAFPSQRDETAVIFQIMTRKREKDECVENYFYHIAALARKINLTEESTIKYIVSGLGDSNLINMLLATNCQTLNELLKQIKRYEEIEGHERQRSILEGGR